MRMKIQNKKVFIPQIKKIMIDRIFKMTKKS